MLLVVRTLIHYCAIVMHAGADRALWGGVCAVDQGCKRCDPLQSGHSKSERHNFAGIQRTKSWNPGVLLILVCLSFSSPLNHAHHSWSFMSWQVCFHSRRQQPGSSYVSCRAEFVRYSVQGNVTVDVRACYQIPITLRQPEKSMHEWTMHLRHIVFASCMHLAFRHVQSVHGRLSLLMRKLSNKV